MTVTDDELAEWERIEQAATPGPWIMPQLEVRMGRMGNGQTFLQTNYLFNPIIQVSIRGSENSHFITAARTALPRLLVELRQARAELAACRAQLDDPYYKYAGTRIGRPDIDARNEQIDGLVKKSIEAQRIIGLQNGSGVDGERLFARLRKLVTAERELAECRGGSIGVGSDPFIEWSSLNDEPR